MPVPTQLQRREDDMDPLASVTAPPPNETDSDRTIRLKKEAEAKMVSDAIDDEIGRAKAQMRKKCMKILLLGQSESGKSTTLKNFQLAHTPRQFKDERTSWRSVIYLNIVRSVRLIVEAVETARRHAARASQPSSPRESSASPIGNYTMPSQLTDAHLALTDRLSRLKQVEDRLISRLSAKGETEATTRSGLNELAVLATSGWKSAVALLRNGTKADTESAAEREAELALENERQEEEAVATSLRSCKGDIETLWSDPIIEGLATVKKLRMEEMPGFFLDSLDRVLSEGYVPSDDDVLRARLKTLGVTEHSFIINSRYPFATEWKVYDVGGTRSLREYWAPYFDDMDAIIFLAPLSSFDQTLVEDSSANRLEDSLMLWKSLCSNRLLVNCQMVLFLNKRDLFERKLKSGIQFGTYVRSYTSPSNDAQTASNYMRKKFEALHKQYSPAPRQFYCHLTSLMDVRSTNAILSSVTDMCMRANLHNAALV